jgi:hypothetical protein
MPGLLRTEATWDGLGLRWLEVVENYLLPRAESEEIEAKGNQQRRMGM